MLKMFAIHPPLSHTSRWARVWRAGSRPETSILTWGEVAILSLCGATAAALVLLVDFKLRIPGHAILRAVFPMACGLALVPRRGVGTIMGLVAAIMVGGSRLTHLGDAGLGSTTSLLCIGPSLDIALRFARSGYWVSIGLGVAGLMTNLMALGVQSMAKAFLWDAGGGKPLALWLPWAAVTYPACGLIAGIVSGVFWFRLSTDQLDRRQRNSQGESDSKEAP